jgi:hypothetical protein
VAAFGVALAAICVLASPAQAAAPNYIMVSGPGLARPVPGSVLAIFARHGVPTRLN